jgi:TonB family protein
VAALVALLSPARGVVAQASDAGVPEASPPPAASVVPPEPIAGDEAVYPEAARAAGIEGKVVLRLSIDAEGRVTSVDLIETPGHGLESAAAAAAMTLRFRPALRDGVPTPSRILSDFDFNLPEPELEPAPPEPESAPAPPEEEALEVTVRGLSAGEQLRRSARAVTVVETADAQNESADLAAVVGRSEGVTVQRSGGLGSDMRFSLNGLSGDQVRFYLDGVPLDFVGYSFGIANIPVNLIERVEIYQGVVPARFGADALGGALNLVSESGPERSRASASYQVGSFGTHRFVAAGRYRFDDTGFFLRLNAFVDHADNDYLVHVKVANDDGHLQPVLARRFHDGYDAQGGTIEAGFVDRPHADRLVLRVFGTHMAQDLQHDALMNEVYGDVEAELASTGASLRYEHRPTENVSLSVVGGYAFNRTGLEDFGECLYNWFGECTLIRSQPGEIDDRPHDRRLRTHAGYVYANAEWTIAPDHRLRASTMLNVILRSGDERMQTASIDPLEAQRRLVTSVTGLEYEASLFGGRLENIVFVKYYGQRSESSEPLTSGESLDRSRTTHRGGAGDSMRLSLTDFLWAKASYEYATRLPNADEIFGDGVMISANLSLAPETSHNLNLGLELELEDRPFGSLRASALGFLRKATDLIRRSQRGVYFAYENVYAVRVLGASASLGWTSPRSFVALDGSATYQDARNTSSSGDLASFRGDRIPNQPYLYANGSARFRYPGLFTATDSLSASWGTRYVHEFFRTWGSLGARASKPRVESQLVHSLAVTYEVEREAPRLSLATTLELQNLTNERVYDFFGVEKPGRAFYLKVVMRH